MAPATTSSKEASPASCPLVRGRPRAFAQRPFPSMTIAMCSGTSCAGRTGGRAPDGCGNGGLLMFENSPLGSPRCSIRVGAHWPPAWSSPLHESQGAHATLQMPLQEGGYQATALTTMLGQALVGDAPVAGEQSRQQLEGGQRRDSRAGRAAGRADGAAAGEVEGPLGSRRTTPCAVVEARCPTRDGQRPQQV